MKSYDFDAVAYDGDIYCIECLPESVGVYDDEVSPIFADQEWDYVPTCCECGAEHDYVTVIGFLLDETIIETPGKFEGEPEYVKDFYGQTLGGMSDDTIYDGDIPADVFHLTSSQQEQLGGDHLLIWQSKQGFINHRIITTSEYSVLCDKLEATQDEDED